MHDGGSIPAHIFNLLNNSTKLLMGCDGIECVREGRDQEKGSVCPLLLSPKVSESCFCLLRLINEQSLWFAQVKEFPIGINQTLTWANLQFDLRYCNSSCTTCATDYDDTSKCAITSLNDWFTMKHWSMPYRDEYITGQETTTQNILATLWWPCTTPST